MEDTLSGRTATKLSRKISYNKKYGNIQNKIIKNIHEK